MSIETTSARNILMYLLFLDTETNSLSPKTGAVIEIGGIITSLDPQTLKLEVVDTFDSLVQLETEFDPRITRLTDITESELKNAEKRSIVQDNWADFIGKYSIDAIIGHSIDFDLAFLTAEGWSLGEGNKKIIDTLHFAKVLYPHLEAVNLEYAFHSLQLEAIKNKLFPTASNTNLHRALYDSELCASFFCHSLDVLSKQETLPSPWYEKVVDLLIPQGVILFNPYRTPALPDFAAQEEEGDWFGMTTYRSIDTACVSLLATQGYIKTLESLEQLFSATPDSEYKIIILSLVRALTAKTQQPKKHVSLHIYGTDSYLFLQTVLTHLGAVHTEIYQPKLLLEQLTGQLQRAFTSRYHFHTINALLTIAKKLEINIEGSEDWLRRFEFWLFYSNQLAVQGVIDPYSPDKEVQVFYQRLVDMQLLAGTLLQELDTVRQHPLGPALLNHIRSELLRIKQLEWKNGVLESIQVSETDITITTNLPDKHVETVIQQVENSKQLVSTYTSAESSSQIMQIAGLPIQQDAIEFLSTRSDYITIDSHNLRETLERARDKRILVLIAQNKHLEKIQNILTTEWNPSEYLLFGETGGITKLLSKIRMNYNSSVFVRLKDWKYFTQPDMIKNFTSICVVGLPYVAVPKSYLNRWGSDWQKSLELLRKFQIESIAGHARTLGVSDVEYWESP